MTEILHTAAGPQRQALFDETAVQLANLRKYSSTYSKHLITSESSFSSLAFTSLTVSRRFSRKAAGVRALEASLLTARTTLYRSNSLVYIDSRTYNLRLPDHRTRPSSRFMPLSSLISLLQLAIHHLGSIPRLLSLPHLSTAQITPSLPRYEFLERWKRNPCFRLSIRAREIWRMRRARRPPAESRRAT